MTHPFGGSLRCESRDSGSNLQCEKPRGHIGSVDSTRRLHAANDLVWGDPVLRTDSEPMLPQFNVKLFAPEWVWPPPKPTDSEPRQQLTDWWLEQSRAEIDATVPKAVEYGSTDLIDIGLMLGRTMKRQLSEEEAAELGVFFYLIGKIARWQSAIERGERPSDDTLFDIGVYVRMAQRIRHAGAWPGTDEPAGGSTLNQEDQ